MARATADVGSVLRADIAGHRAARRSGTRRRGSSRASPRAPDRSVVGHPLLDALVAPGWPGPLGVVGLVAAAAGALRFLDGGLERLAHSVTMRRPRPPSDSRMSAALPGRRRSQSWCAGGIGGVGTGERPRAPPLHRVRSRSLPLRGDGGDGMAELSSGERPREAGGAFGRSAASATDRAGGPLLVAAGRRGVPSRKIARLTLRPIPNRGSVRVYPIVRRVRMTCSPGASSCMPMHDTALHTLLAVVSTRVVISPAGWIWPLRKRMPTPKDPDSGPRAARGAGGTAGELSGSRIRAGYRCRALASQRPPGRRPRS